MIRNALDFIIYIIVEIKVHAWFGLKKKNHVFSNYVLKPGATQELDNNLKDKAE